MTHEQQIKSDLDRYGVAYERRLADGTIERIDPTTIRVVNLKKRDIDAENKLYELSPKEEREKMEGLGNKLFGLI